MVNGALSLASNSNSRGGVHQALPLTILSVYRKAMSFIEKKKLHLSASIIQDKGMYYLYLLDKKGIEKIKIIFLKGISGENLLCSQETNTILFPFSVKSRIGAENIQNVLEREMEKIKV